MRTSSTSHSARRLRESTSSSRRPVACLACAAGSAARHSSWLSLQLERRSRARLYLAFLRTPSRPRPPPYFAGTPLRACCPGTSPTDLRSMAWSRFPGPVSLAHSRPSQLLLGRQRSCRATAPCPWRSALTVSAWLRATSWTSPRWCPHPSARRATRLLDPQPRRQLSTCSSWEANTEHSSGTAHPARPSACWDSTTTRRCVRSYGSRRIAW
mmetsp:Transcript_29670/g.79667  ORF Transcript_29670/g.79667 Transcript_29670/m.79667 type:complete len:212 (-) Transcript_29670:820-1455(-)